MSDTCSAGHARSYSFPWRCSFVLLGTLLFPSLVHGHTDYYRHTYFDNSLSLDFYFYSSGQVESRIFLTPPNALRLQWQSQTGGGWEAGVRVVNFRNRLPEFSGDSLYFWCFAPQAIASADLPLAVLSDTRESAKRGYPAARR
jgi:hypothetical protein